ncbi:uncharacterized repeat protein (TIGR03847 family) [Jatrophihabitans sp. GAS493]|uniref:DUF3090 domain-containing protein n=1 Tax=Jatrophihabitans sp. GAS493 TaxID=1907575 RepID=UPI000BB940C6|nr:DUF3090 domain-containing protein [Jatrophihabitans sp. GAS493]SOD73869.1 uncharacterized repeat protein (TIGR03847 family) [Jatrophihabitans sp. GAS493]
MARQVFLFDHPRRFVAGTVGVPGERTFYLQAADGPRVVSVALEKNQVAVLADRVEELLDDVVSRTGTPLPASSPDTDGLEQPVEEEFRVGAMGLAWDGDRGVVVIEAQAPVEDAELAEETLLADVEEGPDVLRVLLDPRVARAFVERSRRVISAGRPPCPLCGQPLDPAGHICPRQNGYHRRAPLSNE